MWVFPSGCRKFIAKMAFAVGFSSAIVTRSHTHRFEQISASSVLASQALSSVQQLLTGKLPDHWSHTMESYEWVTWFVKQEHWFLFTLGMAWSRTEGHAKFCPLADSDLMEH